MKCYTEEIFGPVLVALNVDTLDEVQLVYHYLYDILIPFRQLSSLIAILMGTVRPFLLTLVQLQESFKMRLT